MNEQKLHMNITVSIWEEQEVKTVPSVNPCLATETIEIRAIDPEFVSVHKAIVNVQFRVAEKARAILAQREEAASDE